ncbi:MAG: hypothetical protein J5I47_01910 [Vicingus serpentipes]|nr:hypothetical protein [Vicingus serpentipes]
MKTIYITSVVAVLISLAVGISEAYYFHNNPTAAKEFNRNHHFEWHFYASWVRVALFTPLVIWNFIVFGGVEIIILTTIMIALPFPWFHDGIYYTFRDILKPGTYPKKWIDFSTTSSAKLSLSAWWRMLLFIIYLGLIPYLLMQYG